MAIEKLKFKLELYATYWDQPPKVEIQIAGKPRFKGIITETEKNPRVIKFEHEFNLEESHTLNLIRTGKHFKQTVVENGKIIKDQLLHIKYVEIDEIDIGALIYEGIYTPEYPEPWASQQREKGVKLPETIKNSPALGHNGTWTFSFSSPFYMWLLENLY